MPPTLPPISSHALRAPCLLLALALTGCWANHAHSDAGAADGLATSPDAALTGARRNGAVGGPEDTDGAADGSPADLATEAGGPDLAADVAHPLDSAPDLAADTAFLASDAAPDLQPDAMVVAPDLAPPPPDLPPPPPDLPPPSPDLAPPPPDLAPDLPPGNGCPSGRGPLMVKADLATKPFCIDATEVTNAQYAAFLDSTGGDTSGQPGACSWNNSYVPVSSDGYVWPATGAGTKPVVNVDWCDARAFCKWAGKRLCGKIGGGSLTTVSAGTSATSAQWVHACSRNGQRTYPYGQTFMSATCNTGASAENATSIASVGSYAGCQGGYTGIYDMSGNVEEWVDACDKNTGGSDACASAGASAYLGGLTPSEITCVDSVYGTPRNTAYVMLGFRCCADLP